MRLILFLFFSVPFFMDAQNVGIGINNPVGRLQVNHISSITSPTILLYDSAISGSPSIRFQNQSGPAYFDLSAVTGSSGSTSFFDFTHSSLSGPLVTLRGDGNLGIGTNNPSDRLSVVGTTFLNGDIKIAGLNLLEFGSGIAGKEVNAGKIGYNAFGQPALTIIGAGTNTTNRKVFFFAEGGTSFSGPVLVTGNSNIGGQLQLNSNPGLAGQVLTSNGAAAPSWQVVPENYPVTDRVMLPVATTLLPSAITATINFGAVYYNLNPATFSTSTSSITINTSGLYEIEGKLDISSGNVTVSAGGAPITEVNLLVNNGITTRVYQQIAERLDQFSVGASTSFKELIPFTIKLHITAGTTLSLNGIIYQYNTASGTPQVTGGYLGINRIN
ncbi:MAG: hypothetical protein ACKVOW_12180 [Chitinophagaceae bacterium]